MNSLFDTHASVKKLKDAGFTEQQAEAQVEVISGLLGSSLATKLDIAEVKHDIEALRLATKADIAELRTELKTDIAGVRTEIAGVRTEIERMGRTIVMWNVGALLAVAGFVYTIIRFGGGP
jgi:hypothetical protein